MLQLDLFALSLQHCPLLIDNQPVFRFSKIKSLNIKVLELLGLNPINYNIDFLNRDLLML